MYRYTQINTEQKLYLVWFDLFVHPFSHICNIGHVNYKLQITIYNTTYNIRTSTQYNIINNNTKFKDQLEVEFVTTSRYMCIYINIPKSSEFKLKVIIWNGIELCYM
jgi:hypothetical protein